MEKETKKIYDFIPCTLERKISKNIVWRPIKSWHSATYAGEKLEKIPNKEDRSGCMRIQFNYPQECCDIPKTVTHRIYWNKNTNDYISAFLSYPDGMGCSTEYFWEIYPVNNDLERFFGENAEQEMEDKIKKLLNI